MLEEKYPQEKVSLLHILANFLTFAFFFSYSFWPFFHTAPGGRFFYGRDTVDTKQMSQLPRLYPEIIRESIHVWFMETLLDCRVLSIAKEGMNLDTLTTA